MAYPSIEQYQTALQHPNTAFTDAELAAGRIRTSNIGWPLVASGGFALTYAVETGASKYAVRCFHREAAGIERRYAAISAKLAGLNSNYFVRFEFQRAGVKINNALYPLVKMAWAQGETLGEFVESNYRNRGALTNLVASLSALAVYLESQGIAHGDIQEGNLMVADGGRKVQLIDYDGMYVPEVASLGGSELGHRDFQHPMRTVSDFGTRLDRFSFIVLNISLRALCESPSLWNTSQSGAGVIVCRANDFAAPQQSAVLQEIGRIPSLAREAKNFAAICSSAFSSVPTLADFVAGRNVPNFVAADASATASVQRIGYLSQYPVLDATDYALFHQHIGSMVELVGKIVDVKILTSYGRTHIFINFSYWKGKAVKIALWTEALKGAKEVPTEAWVGRWVTIKGLVEPVYRSKKYGYEHLTINAAAVTQIIALTEQEAKYRLAPVPALQSVAERSQSNSEALRKLAANSSMGVGGSTGTNTTRSPAAAKSIAPQPSVSQNQRVLQKMMPQPPAPSVQSNQRMHAKVSKARVAPNLTNRPVPQSTNSSLRVLNEALKHGNKQGFFRWLKGLFNWKN
jgi:predicted Ser/Thr protein kinase